MHFLIKSTLSLGTQFHKERLNINPNVEIGMFCRDEIKGGDSH